MYRCFACQAPIRWWAGLLSAPADPYVCEQCGQRQSRVADSWSAVSISILVGLIVLVVCIAAGWNAYADATIAFLQGNRRKLDQALARLKSTPAPPGEDLQDGQIEMTQPNGTKFKMPWPLNVDVVKGLQRCMGEPYRDAYSSSCRPSN
jgi:hypothetical protein